MALSLKIRNALDAAAGVLTEFLPYSGAKNWKGHINVTSVAQRHGLGHYCLKMSKRAAIAALLERTLDFAPAKLEPLVIDIVREGITYRKKNKSPISRSEVEELAGHILSAGIRIPDLFDDDFLNSLDVEDAERATRELKKEKQRQNFGPLADGQYQETLRTIRLEFYELAVLDQRQVAGLKFEKVLNELFELDQLAPRGSFKVTGEQIDGSFVLDHETYLVEAKWEKSPLPEAPLLVFRGKVEGKSQFTRGVFVSLSGISNEAEQAIVQGKQPNFFLIDAADLIAVIEGRVRLARLLRAKLRKLTEEGRIRVSIAEALGS